MAGLRGTGTSTCTEPEAAAIAYASRDRVAEGDRVAVYDLGGGTFDAAVLVREGDGLPAARVAGGGRAPRRDRLRRGGVPARPDGAGRRRRRRWTTRTRRPRRRWPGCGGTASRPRRRCRSASTRWSPVALPGITRSVRLTRGEFEDMLRPAIGETVAAMRRVLDSAGVSAADAARRWCWSAARRGSRWSARCSRRRSAGRWRWTTTPSTTSRWARRSAAPPPRSPRGRRPPAPRATRSAAAARAPGAAAGPAPSGPPPAAAGRRAERAATSAGLGRRSPSVHPGSRVPPGRPVRPGLVRAPRRHRALLHRSAAPVRARQRRPPASATRPVARLASPRGRRPGTRPAPGRPAARQGAVDRRLRPPPRTGHRQRRGGRAGRHRRHRAVPGTAPSPPRRRSPSRRSRARRRRRRADDPGRRDPAAVGAAAGERRDRLAAQRRRQLGHHDDHRRRHDRPEPHRQPRRGQLPGHLGRPAHDRLPAPHLAHHPRAARHGCRRHRRPPPARHRAARVRRPHPPRLRRPPVPQLVLPCLDPATGETTLNLVGLDGTVLQGGRPAAPSATRR